MPNFQGFEDTHGVSPEEPSDLRAILARLKNATADLPQDLEELTDRLGPQTTTFDNDVSAGQPVYASGANTTDLADASAASTARVVGFAADDAVAGEGTFWSHGVITVDDWTDIIGSATLSAGAVYYLSTTAGQMSTTAPSSTGNVVVPLGFAVSQTEFAILMGRPVLL